LFALGIRETAEGYPVRRLSWWSKDGVNWTAMDNSPVGQIEEVVETHGGFYALGWQYTPPTGWSGSVSSSLNGLRWRPVSRQLSFEGAEIHDAVLFGEKLVAVGEIMDGELPISWTSEDGESWQRTSDPPAPTRALETEDPDAGMAYLVQFERSLVAVSRGGDVWIGTFVK
jgi:hypothetical protein